MYYSRFLNPTAFTTLGSTELQSFTDLLKAAVWHQVMLAHRLYNLCYQFNNLCAKFSFFPPWHLLLEQLEQEVQIWTIRNYSWEFQIKSQSLTQWRQGLTFRCSTSYTFPEMMASAQFLLWNARHSVPCQGTYFILGWIFYLKSTKNKRKRQSEIKKEETKFN